MSTYRLRILHISDLHERVIVADTPEVRKRKIQVMAPSRYRVLEGSNFLRILEEIRASAPLDLVCFTGDAADWGLPEEYSRATARLDAILAAVCLPRDRLFLVPGNHDVRRTDKDRPQLDAAWRALLPLAAATDANAFSLWMAGLDAPPSATDAWRDDVLLRTEAYRRWVAEGLGRRPLLSEGSPHGRLGYRASPAGMGLPFPVHLVGLDTAWLAGQDNEQGQLRLTPHQIDILATDEGAPLLGFRIALAHHPLSWLADGGDAFRRLAGHVDLLLHGHQHDPVTEEAHDPDRRLLTLAAGCLYEGDKGDRWKNAFHILDVSLDEAGQPVRYDVEFWSWSEHGHWFHDGALYEKAKDGRLTWWTPLGESLRPPERCLPPAAPSVFIGREEELRILRDALLDPAAPNRTVAIGAVQGMPGVGKSHLAARFIQLYGERFPGGVASLALSPDNPRDADGLCRDLCDALGLPSATPAVAWEALRLRLAHPTALLLIENVDGPPEARLAAEFARRLGGYPLLFTGRYRGLGRSAGWKQVEVRPFGDQDALAQLVGEWRAPATAAEEPEFRRLVCELGCLPLGVHLAAGYLGEPARSIDGFLQLLHGSGLTLGPADPADPLNAQGARAILSATFDISLGALRAALGPHGDRLLSAFRSLGYAPPTGFGRSLGATMAGLDEADFETLAVGAVRLSLLEHEGPPARPREVFRVHPLLAELLARDAAREPVISRMAEWFVARLPVCLAGQEDEQGLAWGEVQAETTALRELLRTVPASEVPRIAWFGQFYAMQSGPFAEWAQCCTRALRTIDGLDERSILLWTLGKVSVRMGDLDGALHASEEKRDVDLRRGDQREVALARGLTAQILETRGDLEQAMRIRREEQIPVYQELGDIREVAITLGHIATTLEHTGDLSQALRIRQEVVLPILGRLREARLSAGNLSQIASILHQRGDPDGALRIWREEVIPVYERVGDLRERMQTLGRIAHILVARGDLDEALRLRREEEIPFYHETGDVYSYAVAWGGIADILRARGSLDEAQRIMQVEELPVYGRLGDVFSYATTEAKIAQVLQAQGHLDEALALLQNEVLPAFQRLSDRRSHAVAIGQVADILEARGDIGEALRIRQEELLPAFERVGDVHSRAMVAGKIAATLYARGELGRSLSILQEDALPEFRRLGDGHSCAIALDQVARILCETGQPDDALRIWWEDVLPVLERTGSEREVLSARLSVAATLWRRGHAGDQGDARRLLWLALEAAKKVGAPEAAEIELWLESLGPGPAGG